MSNIPAPKTSFAGPVPKCATAQQYQEWQAGTRSCPPDSRVGFCEDCTPEYQKQMIRERRCENVAVCFFWEPVHISAHSRNGQRVEAGGYIYGAFAPGKHTLPGGEKVEHEEVYDSL